MNTPHQESEPTRPPSQETPKVYLLPNLMTAGNLFCGFMAILQIIEGTLQHQAGGDFWIIRYEWSLWFILGAFLFDMLDGRLARLGGRESAFGREFDSLADLVSFGLAPALLVLKIILADLPEKYRWFGWLVAFIYLLAGAMRLARFNLVSTHVTTDQNKDFIGFPIPAAAGLVASITLVILTFDRHDRELGLWKHSLPWLLMLLSLLMYSQILYPSFKTLDLRARRSLPQIGLTVVLVVLGGVTFPYSLAAVFLAYLLYGFVRPYISKRIRQEIEEEDESAESG